MRYDKARLDAAYSTVSLFADPAWQTNDSDPYIRANKELWKRECALKGRSENVERPRSVLDTIPNSRLAEYGTYWYDETREAAYKPASNYTTTIAQSEKEKTSSYVNTEFRNEDLFQSQEVERLFEMFTDTNSNNEDIEYRCRNFLKDLEMKEVRPNTYTLTRVSDSSTKFSTSSDSTIESDPEIGFERVKKEKIPLQRPRNPPRGGVSNFQELKLQMQLHSEEIRALWDTKYEKKISNVNVPTFYPKFGSEDSDDLLPPLTYEMVPNVQPWLNCGYPLRHSDFDELAALSSDMDTLRIAPQQTPLRPVQQLPPPPPPSPQTSPLIPAIPKVTPSPPARRLYSAVLQNQPIITSVALSPAVGLPSGLPPGVKLSSGEPLPPATAGTVATVAATTVNTDELDELEREAIEQYRPSNESLGKTSEDSIISAKFQELERLALEQYSASTTETSAGVMGGRTENAGNAQSPLHEPPCGGKPNPYAALLLANWNNVIVGLYRSRLLACLGAGARFR